MKKLLFAFLILFVVFSFGQVRYYDQVVSWNSGAVASDTLITTGADTSDWFTISAGVRNDVSYPETLSFLLWADQTTTTDSTNGAFTLELSNDRTYIHPYGALVTLAVGDVDLKVDDKIVTDMALFKYGRVIVTGAMAAGDSVMFGAQLTRDFSNYYHK